MDTQATTGERVRRLRRARGWTQRELGDAAGCSGPTIADLENGLKVPMLTTIRGIADALEVTLDSLCPSTNQDPTEAQA